MWADSNFPNKWFRHLCWYKTIYVPDSDSRHVRYNRNIHVWIRECDNQNKIEEQTQVKEEIHDNSDSFNEFDKDDTKKEKSEKESAQKNKQEQTGPCFHNEALNSRGANRCYRDDECHG